MIGIDANTTTKKMMNSIELNNIIDQGGWHFCNLKEPEKILYKYKNLCETNDPYIFKEKIDEIPENNNSYVDSRRSLAFYHDKENNIKIDRLHDYLVKFCDMYMEVLKKMTEDTPERFHRIKKLIFEDTYKIYNYRHFGDIEYIDFPLVINAVNLDYNVHFITGL